MILAVAKYGGRAHLNRLYDDAPRIYGHRPATFDSSVRSTLEAHSSDSLTFGHGALDAFTAPEGLGTGVWALRNLNWTIAEVITERGRAKLLLDLSVATPSAFGGDRNPLAKLNGANVIEFAQQILPLLPLWRDSH